MKKFFLILDTFFFRKIPATGFGLMRIAWGGTVLWSMLLEWPDITRYYTNIGILPQNLMHLVMRSSYRFSLLDYVTDPHAVFVLYVLLLLAALCATLGVFPRSSTIIAWILYVSFHERNSLPLAGGETVLRLLGFLLMIAPGIAACSIDRVSLQMRSWTKEKRLLPQIEMSIWPYRLLLWQFIVIYLTSGYDKLTGKMWWGGTAISSVFHVTGFMRNWGGILTFIGAHSFLLSRAIVIYEFTWLLLLVPDSLWQRVGFRPGGIKRTVIFFGILFHLGILLFMTVGTFPYAMIAGYIGLLRKEDFDALRARVNRLKYGKIAVLYDGSCGLCRRSIALLEMWDWLHRLNPEDFCDVAARHRIAADVPLEELNREMHVRIARGTKAWKDAKTFKGFYAFRAISWHVPPLWPFAPFLYLPGIDWLGRSIYSYISQRRIGCDGSSCLIV